jgi:hypothetical protein
MIWRTTGRPSEHRAPSAITAMEKPAALGTSEDARRDRLVAKRNLGEQEHVSSGGQPGFEREPAGVPPHDLDDHHPVM